MLKMAWPVLLLVIAIQVLRLVLHPDRGLLAELLHCGRVRRMKHIGEVLEASPTDFERLCRELFLAKGYAATRTGGSGDGGVDLLCRKDREVVVVQCKRYRDRPVGVNLVRELLGAMTAQRADYGYLITTSRFTRDARDFARSQNIALLDREALIREIQHHMPETLSQECAPAAAPAVQAAPAPARPAPEAETDDHLSYPIICVRCGKPDRVPFEPRPSKALLCKECYAGTFRRR